MSTVSDAMRNHHRELTERLTKRTTTLEEGRPEVDLEALIAFLKHELLPHAQGEEQHLYPALNPIIQEHGTPTATMSVDHEFIGGYVRQIEETVQALQSAGHAERSTLQQRLRRLVLQLDRLFQVHLAKEERIYLPLLEQYVTQEDQQRILDGMHEAPTEDKPVADVQNVIATLDVRNIPPARRHPMIFGVFEALHPGTSFILVNDHDPKPLHYQLSVEHKGELVWEYLEEGPETWRVRVGKTA